MRAGLIVVNVLLLPDRALYVSVCGYHCLPGQGEILRIATEN